MSEGAVLVGGQALAFWVARFGVNIKDGPRVYISSDADFLGFREHVERFSRALGGKAVYPPKRGATALHGAVERNIEGTTIGVDVLRKVVGLDPDAVRRRAIAVTHPKDASLRFLVMEPVDCLVSRFENLRRIAERQNEIGVWQAGIAVAVCRAYVAELIRLNDERKAIKVATAVFQLAGSATGLQAYAKYRLDIVEAIPLGRFTSESFKNEQVRRSLAVIAKARANLA